VASTANRTGSLCACPSGNNFILKVMMSPKYLTFEIIYFYKFDKIYHLEIIN
jgi:hypothetical protein